MPTDTVVNLNEVEFIGENLHRPECVVSTSNGRLICSNWKGGVTIIEPDGDQWELLSNQADVIVKPNGIALMPDGSVLLANLGDDTGGVYRLSENRELTPFVTEIDNQLLPPTNFAHRDYQGRIWITVSTRHRPRAAAYRSDIADGFIILSDSNGTRIVADNLGYTNECIVDPSGEKLYVNETFSRRLTSFSVTPDGKLTNRKTLTEFPEGVFPDGFAIDQEGHLWIASIVSNRIIRVSPEGEQVTILEDADPTHLSAVEDAYRTHSMGRPHLDQIKSDRLQNISSIAFGGADLKTAYMGCLLGDRIASFRTSFAGLPPSHWNFKGPNRK